jgi:hypothetical protein
MALEMEQFPNNQAQLTAALHSGGEPPSERVPQLL